MKIMYKWAIAMLIVLTFMPIVLTVSAMEPKYRLFDQEQIESFSFDTHDEIIDDEQESPLNRAVRANQEGEVKRLLKQGEYANKLSNGRSPLYWAIFYLNTDIIILLRKHGAEPWLIADKELRLCALDYAESVLSWAREHDLGSHFLEYEVRLALTQSVEYLK